jgi:hypothetical protein
MMATTTKIPLKCDICPKKPRFSDVSHLLTHISSKTHLSNIFKARVRLEVDTEARRLIEDYDQWFAEWNIHDLLAERMSQKENKVTKPRARGGEFDASKQQLETRLRPHQVPEGRLVVEDVRVQPPQTGVLPECMQTILCQFRTWTRASSCNIQPHIRAVDCITFPIPILLIQVCRMDFNLIDSMDPTQCSAIQFGPCRHLYTRVELCQRRLRLATKAIPGFQRAANRRQLEGRGEGPPR